MKIHNARERGEKLPVRIRHVIAGDGAEAEQATVYCPFRQRSLELAQCIACRHSSSVVVDPSGTGTYVRCDRVEPQPDAPPPEEGSMHMEEGIAHRSHTPVSEIMTRTVLCVRQDVSIEDVTRLLLERGLSGVPVVDERGKPLGVVSKTDLLRWRQEDGGTADATLPLRVHDDAGGGEYELGRGFHEEPLARATVAEIMMPLAFTLSEHASISRAAALLACERVHRVAILDDSGTVVGLLSSLDLARWLARQDGYVV